MTEICFVVCDPSQPITSLLLFSEKPSIAAPCRERGGEMSACASKQKVLKEEGIDAPVTREIEPIETRANVDDAGYTAAEEVAEVGAAKEATETPAAAGGDGDEVDNCRQSLEVLLKEAEAKEAAISTEQTAEHFNTAALAEDKAPAMMETKESEQPAQKVELSTVDPATVRSKTTLPVDEVEKPAAACENPEPAVDKFIVETKTTAGPVKESSAVFEQESKTPDSTTTEVAGA